jgi:hypothetical protein
MGAIDWSAEKSAPSAATGAIDWSAESSRASPAAPSVPQIGTPEEFAFSNGMPTFSDLLGGIKNVAMGGVKGASDIGTTLLASPLEMRQRFSNKNLLGQSDQTLSSLITGKSPQSADKLRRASLGQFFNENADTGSLAFKGGELAADVAGTAGVPGAIAGPLRSLAPTAGPLSTVIPRLATAIESGGFNVGKGAPGLLGTIENTALRATGGAVAGGATAGLLDPNSAGTGALLGGAIPVGSQVAGKVAQVGSRVVGNALSKGLGLTTGAGNTAIEQAYQAGQTGNRTFVDNMRGNADMTDVLEQAKGALDTMRAAKSAEYRSGMMDIGKDKTILDFAPIKQAVDDAQALGFHKGIPINPQAAGTISEISDLVNKWAMLPPSQYHTAVDFDALKKAIGNIRDSAQFGTPARKAADTVYNAVKGQITQQAPTYAKTMQAYAESSDLIKQIEKALSLGEKASADTSMRKLQSLMRNNVNTNYGVRAQLAQQLEQQGGANVMPALAGQALNSWTGRGVGSLLEKGGIMAMIMHPPLALKVGAAMPFTSPRIVGEGAYAAGRAANMFGQGAQNVVQRLGQNGVGLLAQPQYQGLLTTIPAAAYAGR